MTWFVCLKRMGSNKIPKMIPEWHVKGTRRKGKTREKRMGRVRRSMISKDFTNNMQRTVDSPHPQDRLCHLSVKLEEI